MQQPVILAITSGDRDGVGLEVAVKALNQIAARASGLGQGVRFLLACSEGDESAKELENLRSFRKIIVSSRAVSMAQAADMLRDMQRDEILVWCDRGNEAKWVESAAKLSLKDKLNGIITGPVSKDRFKKLNRQLMGHTGLLSALAKAPVQQGYVGSELSVVLATDHVALKDVEKSLGKKRIPFAIENAKRLREILPDYRREKPIALLGLNPHAGEGGLIGTFEKRSGLKKYAKGGVIGPLAADTAFTTEQRSKYSVVIALYHDQGLIPFKLLHGQDSGYQVSLGLPFVRTSVDHGTAKDIFGLGRANPGSMVDAILGAVQMVQNRTKKTRK